MSRLVLYFAGCAAILTLALAMRVVDPAPVAQLRSLVFDLFQRISPRAFDPALPVRIVDIDNASIKRIGQWPWPRTVMAQLVERLGRAGAAAVAFDVVFSEPDRASPENSLKFLPQNLHTETLKSVVRTLPQYDTVFAQSLADAPAVLGVVLNEDAVSDLPQRKAAFAHAGDDPRPFLPRFTGGLANLEALEAEADGIGALNWTPDNDQIIRRVPLLLDARGELFPSLTVEALRVAQGASTIIVKSSNASGAQAFGARTGVVSLKVGAAIVPTDAQGQLWIRYTRSEPRRFIPAWHVIDGHADTSEIEGRIILVGTSAPGLYDLRTTPLDAVVPGVEVHAQALEQILSGEFLSRPDYALALELLYMLVAGAALALLVLTVGAEWSGLLGLVAIASVSLGSWLAYRYWGLLLDPLYPSLVAVAIYLFATLVVYVRSEMERRQVRRAFGRYLSPELVRRLADNPERLVLGGEIRDMTILFCDIRGFTTLSEGMDARRLTDFVNRFLTPMTDAILKRRGTIDKYMGDCVMAFWNAPLDDPEHAVNACRAALDMRAALERLNRVLEDQAAVDGRPFQPIRVGIGISTGESCVGNMGSDQRFDYSVIGDNVNIASRLEGLSKTYQVTTVVAESTVAQTPQLASVELDHVNVKGKARPVRVCALLGDETLAQSQAFDALARDHAAMMEAYRACRWDEAACALESARAHGFGELEGLYDLYAGRIAGYRTAPPPAEWDGVFVAQTK